MRKRAESAGNQLRARMREKGIKQQDLAKRMVVSQGTVSRWTLNKRKPTLTHAFLLEVILGLSVAVWGEAA